VCWAGLVLHAPPRIAPSPNRRRSPFNLAALAGMSGAEGPPRLSALSERPERRAGMLPSRN